MKILAALFAAAALAACSSRDAAPRDSTLARDLALANQSQVTPSQFVDTTPSVTPAGQPRRAPRHLNDPPEQREAPRSSPAAAVAVAPAPVAAAPAPAPAPAPVASRQIGAGTVFTLASQQRICTSSSRAGDRFVATIKEPVIGTNGAVIPAASTVTLEIVALDADAPSMAFRVITVDFNGMSYPANGDLAIQTPLERTRLVTDPNGDKKKVIGGAIAGAIIGQIIGHNTKGTIIGAATGAAGGAVAAKATEKFESCLPLSGVIRLTLAQAMTL